MMSGRTNPHFSQCRRNPDPAVWSTTFIAPELAAGGALVGAGGPSAAAPVPGPVSVHVRPCAAGLSAGPMWWPSEWRTGQMMMGRCAACSTSATMTPNRPCSGYGCQLGTRVVSWRQDTGTRITGFIRQTRSTLSLP